MMKFFRNEKGIALVMVLVLSFIALAIVSAMLFMITQGTRLSGYQRFFRTAEEAGIGGAETLTDFIGNRGTPPPGLFNVAGLYTTAATCMNNKLSITMGTTWPASNAVWTSCGTNNLLLDPTLNPDLQFDTPNVLGQPSYRVFVKIVDTVKGNSFAGGLVSGGGRLGGQGVVVATTGIVNPPHNPYLYRVEILARDTANPREVARFTVLYAY